MRARRGEWGERESGRMAVRGESVRGRVGEGKYILWRERGGGEGACVFIIQNHKHLVRYWCYRL